MSRLRLMMLVAAASSSLAACAWWMAGRSGLFKLDQLVFSHATHKENDVDCDTCHTGVAKATHLDASFAPREETCLECHDRDNCALCHSDVARRQPRGAPEPSELGFSHQAHADRVPEGCPRCHVGIEQSTGLPIEPPSMDLCLACHPHGEEYAQARCQHCHPSLRALPLRAVAEFDHTGDWESRHGLQARAQGDSCLQCHPQSSCAECHSRVAPAANVRLYPEAVERNLIHRGDWRSTHAIEARLDGDTCVRCHTNTGFCSDCHRAAGLGPGAFARTMPHPPGYATRGGTLFHGDEARLHIETCAACHDRGAASSCVTCHRVGGIGGNPHPPGWSDRVGERRSAAVCQTCHVGGR